MAQTIVFCRLRMAAAGRPQKAMACPTEQQAATKLVKRAGLAAGSGFAIWGRAAQSEAGVEEMPWQAEAPAPLPGPGNRGLSVLSPVVTGCLPGR